MTAGTKRSGAGSGFSTRDKDARKWTVRIAQPEYVTREPVAEE